MQIAGTVSFDNSLPGPVRHILTGVSRKVSVKEEFDEMRSHLPYSVSRAGAVTSSRARPCFYHNAGAKLDQVLREGVGGYRRKFRQVGCHAYISVYRRHIRGFGHQDSGRYGEHRKWYEGRQVGEQGLLRRQAGSVDHLSLDQSCA